MYGSTIPYSNYYPNYTQPYVPYIVAQSIPMYNSYGNNGSYSEHMGYVTYFVRWIEDYPLPKGLKMPSHIGTYNGKGDPDNYLNLLEGDIRMKKWVMPVTCHMFTYTLQGSARIWWNGQKARSVVNFDDLKARLRSHFSNQKRYIKTNLAIHNI